MTKKDDDDEGSADLGKIVNLMQWVSRHILTLSSVTAHMAVFQRGRVLCGLPFLAIFRFLPGPSALDDRDDIFIQVGALSTALKILDELIPFPEFWAGALSQPSSSC